MLLLVVPAVSVNFFAWPERHGGIVVECALLLASLSLSLVDVVSRWLTSSCFVSFFWGNRSISSLMGSLYIAFLLSSFCISCWLRSSSFSLVARCLVVRCWFTSRFFLCLSCMARNSSNSSRHPRALL